MDELAERQARLADRERPGGVVLADRQAARLEVIGAGAARLAQRRDPGGAAGRRVDRRWLPVGREPDDVGVAERDQVADVIEVQVREHDRIERRGVAREQRGEDARAAVEQDA